jgi:hypothetical protein
MASPAWLSQHRPGDDPERIANGRRAMKYDGDGERWDVYLSKEGPHDGLRSVIFHCTSNSSHGWRVAEVPEDRIESEEVLEGMDDDELDELYQRSQPFDYSHDPHAREDHIGGGGGR